MADESFDYDELENMTSQPTVTAWSSQIARPRVTRTYGRSGSTGVLPRRFNSSFARPQAQEPLDENLSPRSRAEDEFGHIPDFDGNSLPVFKPDAPKMPGRRRFTRANSMSDAATCGMKNDPILRRSMSVSDSSATSATISTRSSSFSSGLGSIASLGVENFHPNQLEPLEELASPKRSARPPLEVRGRKKSRSASMDNGSISLSSSFSNLAREETISTWGKPSPPSKLGPDSARFSQSVPDFNELEFLDSSSPDISSVGSHRKRGVCESPCEPFDDISNVYMSMPKRSSLFSPPTHQLAEFYLETVEKVKDSNQGAKYFKKSKLMDISSDEGSGVESGLDRNDSDGEDASMGEDENRNSRQSPVPTFVPFDERQKRRSSVTVFPETVVCQTSLDPYTSSVDDVINTMSSYQDMKYLTKRLRSQREGSVCWHVALPSAWGEAQRRGFIQWITASLGFTHRKAGAQAAYFQIPKSKGTGILKLLEASIAACKERGIGGKSPTNACAALTDFFGASLMVKTPVGLSVGPARIVIAETSNELDSTLMHALESLGVNDRPAHVQLATPATKPSECPIFEELPDLPSHEPRHSLDNHTNSHDLMAHMHGVTPVPKMPPRPPRLSTGSVATQGTVSKYNAVSPFPPAHINITGSGMKCLTQEFVETPMMKPVGWGSCPVDGRDWGTSEAINESTTQDLLQTLDHCLQEAGAPIGSSKEMVAEPRAFSLDLELEAVGGYRAPDDSSPDSTSRQGDNSSDAFGEQDFFYNSSPSSHTGLDNTLDFRSGRGGMDGRAFKRRQTAFEKRKRMSLFASAINPASALLQSRKSLFTRSTRKSNFTKPSVRLESNLISEHKFGVDIHMDTPTTEANCLGSWHEDDRILVAVFGFLTESELIHSAFLVNNQWADAATHAHAVLMLTSVGCRPENILASCEEMDDDESDASTILVPKLLERSWDYLTTTYPWARFLAEGGFKAVFKVYNRIHRVEEAMSIMNIDLLKDSGEMNVVGMELAVSVMLSSLVRRGVCPNFVMTREAFSSSFRPPATLWGNEDNKCPKGEEYLSPAVKKQIRQPKKTGRYQYIRMELCDKGDTEEYMKTLPSERFDPLEARLLLFQMAYALHTAAIKFSLKHYDVKLLNFFIQSLQSKQTGTTILRYQLGDRIFALKTSNGQGHLAKLADYGTANVDATTTGQPVTLAQITTPENTPIDYIVLGDSACQGHGHDNFGLGLCMLHLYTGHAPYEEIMEQVKCPPKLKRKLQELWECGVDNEFSIIQAHVLHNVDKDETGHILEGEPDEVLYHTLYRFLVLFGLPTDVSPRVRSSRVWSAVLECLDGSRSGNKKTGKGKKKNDVAQYTRDCRKFSMDHGTNKYIARAREALTSMEGGMDLLKSLVSIDPDSRFTALDTMNSMFMEPLREPSGQLYAPDDDVRTYTIPLN